MPRHCHVWMLVCIVTGMVWFHNVGLLPIWVPSQLTIIYSHTCTLMTECWTTLTQYSTAITNNNSNNRFMALCPGLPGWASTRRNTHPPTILIIIQFLSAFSSTTILDILPVQIYCNLFAQPLSTSSLVYLLVWSPPPHIPYSSSPNLCLLFATHVHPPSQPVLM